MYPKMTYLRLHSTIIQYMKSKLVYVSLVTRVVVKDDASDDLILECAKVKLIDKIKNELHENVEEIVDDVECPYDVEFDN
jgi:hypothetical protein